MSCVGNSMIDNVNVSIIRPFSGRSSRLHRLFRGVIMALLHCMHSPSDLFCSRLSGQPFAPATPPPPWHPSAPSQMLWPTLLICFGRISQTPFSSHSFSQKLCSVSEQSAPLFSVIQLLVIQLHKKKLLLCSVIIQQSPVFCEFIHCLIVVISSPYPRFYTTEPWLRSKQSFFSHVCD